MYFINANVQLHKAQIHDYEIIYSRLMDMEREMGQYRGHRSVSVYLYAGDRQHGQKTV